MSASWLNVLAHRKTWRKFINLAFQANMDGTTVGAWPGSRLIRDTLTVGTLAVMSCLTVVFLAANSSVYVNLISVTITAMFGLFVVCRLVVPHMMREAVHAQFSDTVVAAPVDRIQTLRQQRLRSLGNKLLERTRARNRPLTVALFDFGDLPELQAVFAGEVAHDLGPTIANKLKSIAPRKGIVVRTGRTMFMVLLPNFDTTRTRAAIVANFGRACCIELSARDDEMLLVPDFLVQTVRRDTSSVEDVYRILCSDLIRGQLHEERRQMYLKAERESHVRRRPPFCPIDGTEIKQTQKARLAPIDKTMPAPLGMR